jgi:hypothetical protein
MTRLRAMWAGLIDIALVTIHRLLNLVRGPALHILVTGPDDVTMTALAVAMKSSSTPLSGVVDVPASHTSTNFSRVVITSSLTDLTHSSSVLSSIGRYRRVCVVAATADPRDLVCARWPELPHQWAEGFDYRFQLGPDGTKSFTEPGVLPRFEGLDDWTNTTRATVVTVTRENLIDNPSGTMKSLAQALPGSPSWLRSAVATLVPSLPTTSRWNESAETKARVAQQVALAPGLEERALALGYLTKAPKPTNKRSAGTIIAFHTPDEVYRAEAARLKKTLDALGLKYHFFEVSPEKNWVRTTLLKPSWIQKAREELSGPLLYIDVDAFVHRDPWPYLSQYTGDLAAVVYENGELNSATIWVNDTPGARTLLSRWLELANKRRGDDSGDLTPTGDNGDQGVLRLAMLEFENAQSSEVRFQRFPVNLTYIFDRGDLYYTVGPVLVEQLQASRESTQHPKRLARRRARLAELETSLDANSSS